MDFIAGEATGKALLATATKIIPVNGLDIEPITTGMIADFTASQG